MNAISEAQFDPVYWASKSPAVNNMMAKIRAVPVDIITDMQRLTIAQNTAYQLIGMGRTGQPDLVDNAIMVWLYGPYWTMNFRLENGITTLMDGTGQYPIKVSIDLDDYPPYVAPISVG